MNNTSYVIPNFRDRSSPWSNPGRRDNSTRISGLFFNMAAQQEANDQTYAMEKTNFTKYKVPQLKTYLQERGVSCSDYKKDALVHLCEESESLQLQVIKTPDDYQQSVASRQTVVVDSKEVRLCDVFKIKDNEWSENLKTLPSVDWPPVVVYLMESCGWTPAQLLDYKQTRAFYLQDSRHVDRVKIHHIKHHEYLYVKSDCARQTSTSEKPYTVWVLMKNNGQIHSAGCQCTGYVISKLISYFVLNTYIVYKTLPFTFNFINAT